MYGEKIKYMRKKLNLSQEDLANKIGLTRQSISKWETGKASPTMANLKELSEVFGVDMAYFIGEYEEQSEREDNKDKKTDKKKSIGKSIGGIFIYAMLCAIGFFFFTVYYYGVMDRLLGLVPNERPYIFLTIYMAFAVIAFPQAYKDLENKMEGLEYNVFSKLVLPVVYVLSPIIVIYYVFKKKA